MSYFTDASVLTPALGHPATLVYGPGPRAGARRRRVVLGGGNDRCPREIPLDGGRLADGQHDGRQARGGDGVIKLYELFAGRPPIAVAERPDTTLVRRRATNVQEPAGRAGLGDEDVAPWTAVRASWLRAADHDTAAAAVAALRSGLRPAGARQSLLARETVHIDRARVHEGIKALFLLTRQPDMRHRDCIDYWQSVHAPLVARTFGDALVRYSTNDCLPATMRSWWPEEAPPYDGIAELWFDLDQGQWRDELSRVAPLLAEDERRFIGSYRVVVAREMLHVGRLSDPLPVDEVPA